LSVWFVCMYVQSLSVMGSIVLVCLMCLHVQSLSVMGCTVLVCLMCLHVCTVLVSYRMHSPCQPYACARIVLVGESWLCTVLVSLEYANCTILYCPCLAQQSLSAYSVNVPFSVSRMVLVRLKSVQSFFQPAISTGLVSLQFLRLYIFYYRVQTCITLVKTSSGFNPKQPTARAVCLSHSVFNHWQLTACVCMVRVLCRCSVSYFLVSLKLGIAFTYLLLLLMLLAYLLHLGLIFADVLS
jgi:hypothetical protein